MASAVAAQTWPGHHGLSARWTRNVASAPKRVLCLAEAEQRFQPVSLDLGIARRTEAAWSADPYFVNGKRAQTVAYVRKAKPDPASTIEFARKAVLAGDIDDVEALVRQGRDAES